MFRIRPFVLALLLTATAFAADPADKPKPQPPQRVNVVKTDGKVVSGLLTNTDHGGLTVKPAAGDELMVPWAEVKSTSVPNLTRTTWLAKFKQQNAERLCDTCKGEAVKACDACKGTGVDPAQGKACGTCKGTGSAGPCPTKGCVDGKIDCPANCIKLTRGVWKDEGGTKWTSFRTSSGMARVSEHHVGEIIVFENGNMTSKGPCPTCGGTTKVDDPVCKGKGHKLCPDCKGAGATGPACPTCDHGSVKCDACKGTGLKPA